MSDQESPVVDEKIWNAWLQKGKIAEQRTNSQMRIAAGVVLTAIGIAAALYIL